MRKSVRKATVVLALTPLGWLPAAAAIAAGSDGTTTITTPAPDGAATAVAAEVSGIVAIGKTSAHAGSGGAHASADALDVLGQRISGGDQKGPGSGGASLIGTGATPVGDVEVAPWSAKVTGDATSGYTSHAEAALAHADIAGAAELWLLHAQSDATWSPDKSTGDAQSDGAELKALGALDIKVLHSEAHSDGTSKSDLLVLNGNELGSSDDANGMCQLDASPLLDLICLTATGGVDKATGATTSGADVLTADIGGGALTGTVSGTTSGGGTAPAGSPEKSGPGTPKDQVSQGGRLPHTTGDTASGTLPFTGADVERTTAIAAALAALGAAMAEFGRRRRIGTFG